MKSLGYSPGLVRANSDLLGLAVHPLIQFQGALADKPELDISVRRSEAGGIDLIPWAGDAGLIWMARRLNTSNQAASSKPSASRKHFWPFE